MTEMTTAGKTGLSSMLLPELKQMAQHMGITGASAMRKGDLVAAIADKQGGAAKQAGAAKQGGGTRTRGAQRPKRDEQQDSNGEASTGAKSTRVTSNDEASSSDSAKASTTVQGAADRPEARERNDRSERNNSDRNNNERSNNERSNNERSNNDRGDRNGRNSERSNNDRGERNSSDRNSSERNSSDRNSSDRNSNDRNSSDRNSSDRNSSEFEADGSRRRRRGRERGRPTRDRFDRSPRTSSGYGDSDLEVSEDDVLVPVAGILDVLDSYAFVRTSGYLPSSNDVYVPLGNVRKYGLRKGDAITGATRQPREGERREKFTPLVRIDTVNGGDLESARNRPEFSKLTPLYPQDRLRLETDAGNLTTRVIDMVAPIGKGQRGLIVSPPKAGKTMVMQAIANAISTNNPEVHLMVVLVDERPEEVTDMQRSVKGEVIASTFDRPAEDHTTIAELAIERAKRLVELGHDVVVLLDSMTRLGRAYNLSAPASGRILSGGVDSAALYPPKKFFGAARNIENGGSLTIIASALVETGSRMDEVIFEEFKGTGNMELKLDRRLADKRIFPAVDVDASGTRKEDLLMSGEELKIVWKLRRVLHALDQQQSIELLMSKLRETKTNYDFLLQVQKTTPAVSGTSFDDE